MYWIALAASHLAPGPLYPPNMAMHNYHIQPSTIAGCVSPPPSKSHSQRAILFASLSAGTCRLHNILRSPDTLAMIEACRLLGAEIIYHSTHLEIAGTHGIPHPPLSPIQAGNSGIVLRFIAAVAALTPKCFTITGDHSIRHNRPMYALITGLSHLGVSSHTPEKSGYAPITLTGPLQPGHTRLDGQDSQPVSALLIATPFLKGPSIIEVDNPGELPWIDITLGWLKRLNIPYQCHDYRRYVIPGHTQIQAFDYTAPTDSSALAYPLVAAIITQSPLTIENVDLDNLQGDQNIIEILKSMGANIEVDQDNHRIRIQPSAPLHGCRLNVNACIDEVPILAVVACYAQGTTQLTHAANARHKECDRLHAMETELSKMGAQISQTQDGLIIQGQPLKGCLTLNSHDDHRVALSLTIAALSAKGDCVIHATDCVDKSYPDFVPVLQQLGVKIQES